MMTSLTIWLMNTLDRINQSLSLTIAVVLVIAAFSFWILYHFFIQGRGGF